MEPSCSWSWVALMILLILSKIHLHCAKEGAVQMQKDGKAGDDTFIPDNQEEDEFSIQDDRDTLQNSVKYSNGDVRLVSVESASACLSPSSGRLEVHMKTLLDDEGSGGTTGTWGSVCGVGFTLKEANVACRQLGFATAWKFELSSLTGNTANDSIPIFLQGAKCSRKDHSHLMRCKASSQKFLNCSHEYDVNVYCNATKIWSNPYKGQVRLVNENSTSAVSSGRVEVYQANVWGTVCIHDFSQAAADSVCRQLGYTNAVAITNANPGVGLVWVGETSCDSSSACFKSCYEAHRWSHACNHTSDAAVQCTYDASLAKENSSGFRGKCRLGIFPASLLVLVITMVLASLLTIGCAGVLVYSGIRCCLQRRKYSPRNYDALS